MNKLPALTARAAPRLFLFCLLLPAGTVLAQQAARDVERIVGVTECAECHKDTTRIWEQTHHHALFDETHRSQEGRKIAKQMGVKRTKGATSMCTSCHYTMKLKDGKPRAVAGVSCESCHGPARDWLERHSEFSGKEEEDETPEEEQARWVDADAAGMIRPRNLLALARNCLGCHITPNEDLVNNSEHSAGSEFELLAWSQGEVRHNVWYSETNDEAGPARKRMLYLAGLTVELEASLAALAAARDPGGEYATHMAERVKRAAARAAKAAAVLSLPELARMAATADALDKGAAALQTAAAEARSLAGQVLARDGDGLNALDPLLPTPADYVGELAP